MSLWDRHVLPHLVRFACGAGPVDRQRQKVVPRARGRVVELGVGSGLNLPHYDPARVTEVVGVDPSPALLADAREVARGLEVPVTLHEATAEALPVDAGSADTVVVTYTLCTVPDPGVVLAEARRVLAPGGSLLFCEHGEAPDPEVLRWQRRVGPLWARFGGGCQLDRPIPRVLETHGFTIEDLDTMYVPGIRVMSFNYWGSASPRDSS